jgi:hypothetical protein
MRASVKGFTTFEMSTGFRRFFVSPLFVTCALSLVTLVHDSCVRGLHPIFGPPTSDLKLYVISERVVLKMVHWLALP